MRTKKMVSQGPAVVLIYGPSGSGKTTDMGYSFPNALFLATRGALQSITHTCGYTPAQVEVKTIQDATKVILDCKAKGAKFDAVVVDDFSFMAERTFAEVDKKFRGNNFAKWGKLSDITLEFRDATRHHHCHVVINCWEQPPKTTNDGVFRKGGPMLAGKLVEKVPSLCDQVFRVGHEKSRAIWPSSYLCEKNHPRWLMKDRFGLVYNMNPAPMNLAEILREAGYEISRHKDLKDQEKTVEQLAQHFSHSDSINKDEVNKIFAALAQSSGGPKAAQWTIRDALDRTIIRRAVATKNSRYFA